MGYDYEDAWNELKDIFHELKSNEENATPLDSRTKEWLRNKMSDIEQNIIKK